MGYSRRVTSKLYIMNVAAIIIGLIEVCSFHKSLRFLFFPIPDFQCGSHARYVMCYCVI